MIKILACMTPGWYCWWVDAACGVFEFVSSTGRSSWVFYPLFLRMVLVLKTWSAIAKEGKNNEHYME
jgi:hypothetical protein